MRQCISLVHRNVDVDNSGADMGIRLDEKLKLQHPGPLSLSVAFILMIQNTSKSSSHCIYLPGSMVDEVGKNMCKLSWKLTYDTSVYISLART